MFAVFAKGEIFVQAHKRLKRGDESCVTREKKEKEETRRLDSGKVRRLESMKLGRWVTETLKR